MELKFEKWDVSQIGVYRSEANRYIGCFERNLKPNYHWTFEPCSNTKCTQDELFQIHNTLKYLNGPHKIVDR